MNTSTDSRERQLRRLRIYNLVMGAFHAAQGLAILALANDFSLPVTASFMEGPPGSAPPELRDLVDVRIAWGVALFVFISAAAHWIIAAPGVYEWYARNLGRTRNYARWIEYSVSSSVMVVLIAMFTGISDVAALVAIFGVNAAMILFGLLMEHYEEPGSPNWSSFIFGCLALDRHRHLFHQPGVCRFASRLRRRHLRLTLHLLQLLRAQHVPPVPAHWSVARLPLRRSGLRAAEPHGEVCPRLADLREYPRRRFLTVTSRPASAAPGTR